MKFITEVVIPRSEWKIDYQSKILCLGSCFSQESFSFLERHKFQAFDNIAGISYNPISIARSLDTVLEQKEIISTDLVCNQDLYFHFDFHGQFADTDPVRLTQVLNNRIQAYSEQIAQIDFLIITLGTAYAFRHRKKGIIVNNCHKFPSQDFERVLLSSNELVKTLTASFENFKKINPNLKILISVSPVRHIRDGLRNNQLSKSTLLLTCKALEDKIDYIQYFPSYEIVMDELRDYRYYKDDLIHPSNAAVQIILHRFLATYLDEKERPALQKISKLMNNLSHKTLFPGTEGHRAFIQQNLNFINELQEMMPNLYFEEERQLFTVQLEEF